MYRTGQSSLPNRLSRIRRPRGDRVLCDGQPLAALPKRQVAQRIALVGQQSDTGDRITVRDAVEIGRTPWLCALQPFSTEDETVVSRALAAVEMQGLDRKSVV